MTLTEIKDMLSKITPFLIHPRDWNDVADYDCMWIIPREKGGQLDGNAKFIAAAPEIVAMLVKALEIAARDYTLNYSHKFADYSRIEEFYSQNLNGWLERAEKESKNEANTR